MIYSIKPLITISGLTGTGKTSLLDELGARFSNARAFHSGMLYRLLAYDLIQMNQPLVPVNPEIIRIILDDPQIFSDLNDPEILRTIRAESYAQAATLAMTDPQWRALAGKFMERYVLRNEPGKDLTIIDTHRECRQYLPYCWLSIVLTARKDVRYWRKYPSTPKELEQRDEINKLQCLKNPFAVKIDTTRLTLPQVADIAEFMIRQRVIGR